MTNGTEASMEGPELTPLQKEGLDLSERVQETEKAFQEAYRILSGLDREENRKTLADILSRYAEVKIDSSDLEGAFLLPLKREDLKKEFGVTFFPLSVVVPNRKWASPEGLHYKLFAKARQRPEARAGVFIPLGAIADYPLNLTGMSFYDSSFLEREGVRAHEELHRAYNVFSPFRGEWSRNRRQEKIPTEQLESVRERWILNEINALRDFIKSGGSWEKVFEILLLGYPSLTLPISTDKISQACETMEHLQKYLPESVITHILLNCKGLDDLNSWSKVKPEEFQELFRKKEK